MYEPIRIIGGYDADAANDENELDHQEEEEEDEEEERALSPITSHIASGSIPAASVVPPNSRPSSPLIADGPAQSPVVQDVSSSQQQPPSPQLASPQPPGSPQPESRIHGHLSVSVSVTNDDGSIVKYEGNLTNVDEDEMDYESLFRTVLRPSLTAFYQWLLRQTPSVRVWSQMNLTFVRTMNDGSEQILDVPMRLAVCLLLDSSHSALNMVALRQIEDLIERCHLLQRTGSGFTFRSFETAIFNVSFVENLAINNIGAPTSVHTRKLYESMAKFHLNTRRRLPLRRHIGGICSDKADCFLLALGQRALNLSKPEVDLANSRPLLEHAKFRNTLLSAAHQFYDLRGLSFPVSVAEIVLFQKNNEERINLNVYAYSKKATKRPFYTVFPFLIAEAPRPNVPTLDLMISRQVSRGDDDDDQIGYHINVIYSFSAMMRASEQRGYGKAFCRTCCQGFETKAIMENHAPYCRKHETTLAFYPRSCRKIFEVGRKKQPTPCIFTFDTETRRVDSTTNFGPLTSAVKRLEPMAVGMQGKFLLHPTKYDPLIPKVFLGENCMNEFVAQLHLESFFVQSLLRQDAHSMTPLSDEEKGFVANTNSCANCRKFLNEEDKRLHHCHGCSLFSGVVCHYCNMLFTKTRPLKIFSHFGGRFDLLLLLQKLQTPAARRHIESIKVFGKSGEEICDITILFRCYACMPTLIPSETKDFACLSDTSATMKMQYAAEFNRMKEIVWAEIRSQQMAADRLSAGNRVNPANSQLPFCRGASCAAAVDERLEEAESAEEEEEEEEDDIRLVSNFSEAEEDERIETELNRGEPPAKCPHKCSIGMRTVKFCDSYSLIRGTLRKTSSEMVTTNVQKTVCPAHPSSSSDQPDINLGPFKTCSCCADKNHIPSLCPDLVNFATLTLGCPRKIDFLTTKFQDFPYRILDLPIEELRNMDVPSDPTLFRNDLRNGEEISHERLQEFLALCRNMGFRSALDAVIGYLFVDVLVLTTLLQFSTIFLARTFDGINLLEYLSISRLGFDLLLEDACKRVGGLGHVNSYTEYLQWSKARFGGFNTCAVYGKDIPANNAYLPDFDERKDQCFVLPIDKSSHYGCALKAKLPWSEYRFHGPLSELVNSMNLLLQSPDGFEDYYRRPNAMKSTYYLVEATISFPQEVQDKMRYFVPVLRRRAVGRNDLSSFQNALFVKLGLKMDEKAEINISDFADQCQTLSMEYLLLLMQLGVKILKVHSVLSAYASPIMAPMVEKLLKMKMEESLSFRKSWFKLLLNSCYGYFLLRVESFTKTRLCCTIEEQKRAVMSHNLNHFNLINPQTMLAYFDPEVVKYGVLLPLGVGVLLESKRCLISDYYEHILPAILSRPYLRHRVLYVDTDSLFLEIVSDSLAKGGKLIQLSEILFLLRRVMDLSGFLPHNGETTRVFEELTAGWTGSEQELRRELDQNRNMAGSYKLEFPYSEEYVAVPSHFLCLREKAYYLQVLHQKSSGDSLVMSGKMAARCGVPKSRMLTYSLADYQRMSKAERVRYASELVSFRSKNFQMYQISVSRAEPTIFSRKRFVLSTGESNPFHYYRNYQQNSLDDREGRKRAWQSD